MYPNGEDKASNANISLYLSVQSEEYVDFAVKFKVGILGRTPDENYFTQMIEKTAEDFGSQSSCKNESENKDDNLFVWGENVISHEELFKQEKNFIVDGELTIVCEVKT